MNREQFDNRNLETLSASELADIGLMEVIRRARKEEPQHGGPIFVFDGRCMPVGTTIVMMPPAQRSTTWMLRSAGWELQKG